jgi:hypothetical protein
VKKKEKSMRLVVVAMVTHVAPQVVWHLMVRNVGSSRGSSSSNSGTAEQLVANSHQQQAGWVQQQQWLQGLWLPMATAAMTLSFQTVTQRVLRVL